MLVSFQSSFCVSAHGRHARRPLRLFASSARAENSVTYFPGSTAKHIIEPINTLILDCDGVIWRGNKVLQGVPQALQAFRAQGIRLLFVTNNSSKSRIQYVRKFQEMGIDLTIKEIVAASYMAAAYLSTPSHPAKGSTKPTAPIATQPEGAQSPGGGGGVRGKVLALGTRGLGDELELAGLDVVSASTIPYCSSTIPWDLDEFAALVVPSHFVAVVLGFAPDFSYRHLCYATAVLLETGACTLVATNPDRGDRVAEGRIMPGTGCLVAALEAATGMQAVVVGKGGQWLVPFLLDSLALDPKTTAVVGDRLDTDVAMGKAAGLCTVVPLTGVCKWRQAMMCGDASPDYVVDSLADMAAGVPGA